MIKAKIKGWYWNGVFMGCKWECGDDTCRRLGGGRGYNRKHIASHSPLSKIPPLERAISGATKHIKKYHREPN